MYPVTTYYQIEHMLDESSQEYSHRCWFIAKQKPQTATELIQAKKWSIIDSAITHKKCEYSEEVTDIVKRMRVGRFKI